MLINGKFEKGKAEPLTVYNPVTGNEIAQVATADNEQTIRALKSAKAAFESWSKLCLQEREEYIRLLIKTVKSKKEQIVECLIAETGKSDAVANYDFEMIENCLDFFIEEAKRLNGESIPDYTGEHLNIVFRKPLGVIACNLAWNYPLLNVGYKLGPILASGCTCVIKPSSETPLATMMLAECIKEAGIPSGVINIVVGKGSIVSKAMNESDIPSMVTLIGSTNTGKQIIKESVSSVKHFSLELGGNAPVVVMKDADVNVAANHTCDGKYGNSGQVCVAPNRIFVHEDVLDEFVSNVKQYVDNMSYDPKEKDGNVYIGPLVNSSAVERMESLVKDALSKGATLICGGAKPKDKSGYYFEPTVLGNVNSDMIVYQEEIFGPIMPIIAFNDEDDIVKLANDTQYGLAAYIYTNDLKNAMNISKSIDSGSVCVNEPFYAFQLPHGGCKQSGIGKDCSKYSLIEYYTVQRVSVKM